ncbi:unnamed protein product [Prorocentrum cordatum]|nr:unnamed protein product [Polarella glacialis]
MSEAAQKVSRIAPWRAAKAFRLEAATPAPVQGSRALLGCAGGGARPSVLESQGRISTGRARPRPGCRDPIGPWQGRAVPATPRATTTPVLPTSSLLLPSRGSGRCIPPCACLPLSLLLATFSGHLLAERFPPSPRERMAFAQRHLGHAKKTQLCTTGSRASTYDRALNLDPARGGEAGATGVASLISETVRDEDLPFSFRRKATTAAPIAPLKAPDQSRPAPSKLALAGTLSGPREATRFAGVPTTNSGPPNSAPTGREAIGSADAPPTRCRPFELSGCGVRALTMPTLRESVAHDVGDSLRPVAPRHPPVSGLGARIHRSLALPSESKACGRYCRSGARAGWRDKPNS